MGGTTLEIRVGGICTEMRSELLLEHGTETRLSPQRNLTLMPLVYCTIALFAVTVIYLFWRSYLSVLLQRRRVLRDRVAHMLWVMAETDEAESGDPRQSVDSPVDVV